MLKAILIDDEKNNLKSLENDLATYCPQITILACCSSGKDGLIKINKLQPNLIFLDIDMPAMNGFEMLQCLNKIDFDIIFTTGHKEYAIDAFRISKVVDYLLKPIKGEQLMEAVKRVEQKPTRGFSTTELNTLITNLQSDRQILPIRASKGIDFLKINDITYARSEGNYITINTIKGKTINSPYSSFTLSYLEQELPNTIFCRIHQSYLININHTSNYNRHEKYVEMTNGKKLPVSNGGRGKLLSMLGLR